MAYLDILHNIVSYRVALLCEKDSNIVILVLQTILFTTDEDILERVSQHDSAFDSALSDGGNESLRPQLPERPLTASLGVCIY